MHRCAYMSTLQLGDNSEDKPSLLQASLSSANDASTAASNLQPLIEWVSDHKPAVLKRPHHSGSLPNVLDYHPFGTAPARAVRNSVKDGTRYSTSLNCIPTNGIWITALDDRVSKPYASPPHYSQKRKSQERSLRLHKPCFVQQVARCATG